MDVGKGGRWFRWGLLARFALTWFVPLAVQVGASVWYVKHENRIYFYDPRGFQEMAMRISAAVHLGPAEVWHTLRVLSQGEYPPYWPLPLSVFPVEALNDRVVYVTCMALVGLVPVTVLTTKIVARVLGLEVTPWLVASAALNPLTLVICDQGTPDLIGFTWVLGAMWLLVSRPVDRRSLALAVMVGAGSLLVKKNFVFDLALLFLSFLVGWVVAALGERDAATRLRALAREIFSARVLLAIALVPVAVRVLTPGTLTAILSRDNALFYVSFRTTVASVLTTNLRYAGGVFALLFVGLAPVALALVARGAWSLGSFLLVSELLWCVVQRQGGIIHQVHVWPLLTSVGLFGLGAVVRARRWQVRTAQVTGALVSAYLCGVMLVPNGESRLAPFLPAAPMPAAFHPAVTVPYVQPNIDELVAFAQAVQARATTGGPVLVPIGAYVLNTELLGQVYPQRLGTPGPAFVELPQVDHRDALPWSCLVADEGRTAVVSSKWVPDLPNGHQNLLNVDLFLQSPAARKWVRTAEPISVGPVGQLEDLQLMQLRIPEADALEFASAIRAFLPQTAETARQNRIALLTSAGRSRPAGPDASTPSTWTQWIGPEQAPTRVLVNEGNVISLTTTSEHCEGLSYVWNDLASAGAPEVGRGAIAPGSPQPLTVPPRHGPWSLALTLFRADGPDDCQVALEAP